MQGKIVKSVSSSYYFNVKCYHGKIHWDLDCAMLGLVIEGANHSGLTG